MNTQIEALLNSIKKDYLENINWKIWEIKASDIGKRVPSKKFTIRES